MEDAANISIPLKTKASSRWSIVLKNISVIYLVLLLIVLFLMKLLGERFWLSSFLIYLPPAVWLLPSFLLVPFCYVFSRKLCWLHVAAAFFVFALFMDFHWSLRWSGKKEQLTLVTNNIGERKMSTTRPFLVKEDPDVIAIQEAWGRLRILSSENPQRYVAGQGQFVLVSKYEIRNSGYVTNLYSSFGPVAAWFEINFHGKSIIIYNVHLPTPRFDFLHLRGRGTELLHGGGIFSGEVRTAYKKSMSERIRLAEGLITAIENEKRPFLLAGDFNMPSSGYIYRRFAGKFVDCFAAKGRGYGLSFPGSTINPLSFFGPWLRIDYIFAGKNWKPLYSRVEPREPAQHLALAGRFEFQEGPAR